MKGGDMTAVERETIQAVEMMKSESPAEIAEKIRSNIREWFDDFITHDVFTQRAEALWDEARALGIDEDVLEIVCPKL
jgi:hypothetical protein